MPKPKIQCSSVKVMNKVKRENLIYKPRQIKTDNASFAYSSFSIWLLFDLFISLITSCVPFHSLYVSSFVALTIPNRLVRLEIHHLVGRFLRTSLVSGLRLNACFCDSSKIRNHQHQHSLEYYWNWYYQKCNCCSWWPAYSSPTIN